MHGHAVLPVLACEQIIAHPDAELGRAGLAEDALDPTVRSGYVEIAERRRTIPKAVVLGMLDPQLAVSRVQTQDGVRFVLSDELDELQKQSAVRSVEQVIPAGQLGNFTGTELRLKYGLASHLVRDRLQLASALQLPAGGVEEDPTLGVGRRAVRVDLTGPIKPDTVNWVERGIREKVEQEQVNFVCLVIDSPGGSPEDSMRLAAYLSSLDAQPGAHGRVRRLRSAGRRGADRLGLRSAVDDGHGRVGRSGARRISPRKSEALRTAVRELAKTKGIGWSLPLAMIDADLAVRRYLRPGTGEVRYFCEQELAEQEHPQDWRAEGDIETRNGLRGGAGRRLAAGAVQRRGLGGPEEDVPFRERVGDGGAELGAHRGRIPGFAPNRRHAAVCGLVHADDRVFDAGRWFRRLRVGGVLCVVLLGEFSARHSGLAGDHVVRHGGRVPGPGDLRTARRGRLWHRRRAADRRVDSVGEPDLSDSHQCLRMEPIAQFAVHAGGRGRGALAALAVARRLVTDVPIFRRVSLETPDEQQREQIRHQEAMVHLDYLVGKRGVTITQLTPSGKACFGDARVDVISDGERDPVRDGRGRGGGERERGAGPGLGNRVEYV